MTRLAAAAAAAALVLGVSGAAQAAVTELTFTTAGAQSPVYLNGYLPGTTTVDDGLGALLSLSLVDVSANGYQWNFSYQLQNLSTDPSRVATIGWDVAEDFTDVTGVSGLFTQYATGGQMPSLDKLDFCLKATPGASCAGGGAGGVASGTSGAGVFSLTFASQEVHYVTTDVPVYNKKGKLIRTDQVTTAVLTQVAAPASLTFNDFAAHYQALADGSSTVGVAAERPLPPILDQNPNLGGLPVPEPATWALMIAGFGAVGAVLRRRRGVLASAG